MNQSHESFAVGQRIRVTDNQAEPPARFTKKHRAWEGDNFIGTVQEVRGSSNHQPHGCVTVSNDRFGSGRGGVITFVFSITLGGRLQVLPLEEEKPQPIYFAEHPSEKGVFIAIKHGETGYSPTTIYTQDHADELNRRSGHTEADIQAAISCSMFNNWNKFDTMRAIQSVAA